MVWVPANSICYHKWLQEGFINWLTVPQSEPTTPIIYFLNYTFPWFFQLKTVVLIILIKQKICRVSEKWSVMSSEMTNKQTKQNRLKQEKRKRAPNDQPEYKGRKNYDNFGYRATVKPCKKRKLLLLLLLTLFSGSSRGEPGRSLGTTQTRCWPLIQLKFWASTFPIMTHKVYQFISRNWCSTAFHALVNCRDDSLS